MKCPACEEVLVMSERQGIEIDYCPKCRGIWLDKGELDKIIERSAAADSGGASFQRADPSWDISTGSENPYRQRHKKKKGFLGDLFDFD